MSNKTLLNSMFHELIKEITPRNLIAESCKLEGKKLIILDKTYDLDDYNNIYLLGSGKAVIPMAQEIEKLLNPFIKKTLLIGPYDAHGIYDQDIYIQSTHPLPSQMSVDAANALQEMLQIMQKDDLFIYLLSGGNSALVELPEDHITLNEFQEATKLMLHSGMPIEKMNSVRKHLSRVKGGKLAQKTNAKGIVLVLSDVIGDDLHAIGSAPFYCDQTSFKEAEEALKHYRIYEKMPKVIQTFLKEGKEGIQNETPKIPCDHIDHHVVGSNAIVRKKAQQLLQREGIATTIIEEPLEGDTNELAKELIKFSLDHQETTHAYIFGGEPTVVVRGEGKGGRNQHLCLKVLTLCDGSCDITFMSAATDGVDGNSNAAGAVVDMHSHIYAKEHNIDPQHYLACFDSNGFFSKTGEVLITGPTHNNLLDIVIILIESNPTKRERNV